MTVTILAVENNKSCLMRSGRLMPGVLLFAVFMISEAAFATEQAGSVPVANNASTTEHNEADDHRPPVEAGTSGGFTMEKSYRAEAESRFNWHTHLQWDSRYVSEGRDNIHGNDMFSLSSEFNLDDITFIPWFARSPGKPASLRR